ISSSGGGESEITHLDASLAEIFHDSPFFLPDGNHFLYIAWSNAKPENCAIWVGSLDSTSRTRLMTTQSNAVYAPPGYLIFMRQGTLTARPFNADSLQFTGDAF